MNDNVFKRKSGTLNDIDEVWYRGKEKSHKPLDGGAALHSILTPLYYCPFNRSFLESETTLRFVKEMHAQIGEKPDRRTDWTPHLAILNFVCFAVPSLILGLLTGQEERTL